VTKQIRQSSTARHPLVRPRAKGLTEGEESVVSFLRAEGETDSGIEAILDHPGPDWYMGVWLDEYRGYEADTNRHLPRQRSPHRVRS
jgi:hypothetical protein